MAGIGIQGTSPADKYLLNGNFVVGAAMFMLIAMVFSLVFGQKKKQQGRDVTNYPKALGKKTVDCNYGSIQRNNEIEV